MQNFTSTAELMVEDEHYDAVHIKREIDLLNNKWTTFHTSVNDYRDLLDTSMEYFKLVEEVSHVGFSYFVEILREFFSKITIILTEHKIISVLSVHTQPRKINKC